MSRFKIINGGKPEFVATCTVKLDDKVDVFEDFVAIGFNKDGKVTMIHNTDILTAAIGLEMLKNAICEMYKKLNDEERELVDSFFEGRAKDEQN